MPAYRHLPTPYTYPWREGNRFHLLVDGERFFPAMIEAIEQAQHTVLLELYLIESGAVAERFINAFCNAARRGVAIYLMFDDFGARGFRQHDRRRLLEAGVRIGFYNPLRYGKLRRNLFRDHRKLLLVDGRIAFTGGTGITDDFDLTPPRERRWHETMLQIEGPCLRDWHELYVKTWNSWGTPPLQLPTAAPQHLPGGRPGRVTLNAPVHMELKRSLIKRIRSAERRIWIATAYFIPSRKIRRALCRAAARGVEVRLLLPGPITDHPGIRHASRRYYGKLLGSGVRIFEYQPRFLHLKLILCDNWISTGSSNIDRWNLSWNLEANQEIDSEAFANNVQQLFEKDFSDSREILHELWHHRRWYRRLLEWFWGKIELWLERHSQRRPGGPNGT